MAAELDVSLRTLIERVDSARGSHNLSSALRLAVLADLKAKADGLPTPQVLPDHAGARSLPADHAAEKGRT